MQVRAATDAAGRIERVDEVVGGLLGPIEADVAAGRPLGLTDAARPVDDELDVERLEPQPASGSAASAAGTIRIPTGAIVADVANRATRAAVPTDRRCPRKRSSMPSFVPFPSCAETRRTSPCAWMAGSSRT